MFYPRDPFFLNLLRLFVSSYTKALFWFSSFVIDVNFLCSGSTYEDNITNVPTESFAGAISSKALYPSEPAKTEVSHYLCSHLPVEASSCCVLVSVVVPLCLHRICFHLKLVSALHIAKHFSLCLQKDRYVEIFGVFILFEWERFWNSRIIEVALIRSGNVKDTSFNFRFFFIFQFVLIGLVRISSYWKLI